MHGLGIGGGMHGNRRYAQFAAGALYPQRYFASVRDQDFSEQGVGHLAFWQKEELFFFEKKNQKTFDC
jgi:hypothetical protein